MLVQVTEYQLEWHPERSPRCRYKLATEDDWSGWLDLDLTDQLLMSMLLSQQPVFYNQLTGVLCMGAGYGEPEAAQAAMPAASAAYAADAVPVGTPNSGDDDEAQAEGSGAAAQQEPEPAAAMQAAMAALPWRTAQALLVLLDQVNRRYPGRNKASDGTIGDLAHQGTNSDHNPHVLDGGMGVVTALDLTHDPAHGCDAHALADALVASRDTRIKYIIWNRRIVSFTSIGGEPAWTWRPYTGANPHNHHMHVSARPEKANYDSTAAWSLPIVA